MSKLITFLLIFLFSFKDLFATDIPIIVISPSKKTQSISTVGSTTTVFDESYIENNIQVDQEGFVIKYDATRKSGGLNGIDIGYFVINKKLLDKTSKENLSFENDMLSKFIEKKNLVAYITNDQYYYITDIKCVKKFENFVSLRDSKPLSSSYFKNIE